MASTIGILCFMIGGIFGVYLSGTVSSEKKTGDYEGYKAFLKKHAIAYGAGFFFALIGLILLFP